MCLSKHQVMHKPCMKIPIQIHKKVQVSILQHSNCSQMTFFQIGRDDIE